MTTDRVLAALDLVVEGIRMRDEASIVEAHGLLQPMLRRLALGLVRRPEVADDVVQDAFVALVTTPDLRIEDGRSLRAWMARTVRNRAIDHLRSAEASRTSAVAEVRDPVSAPSAEDVASTDPLLVTDPILAAALDQVGDDQRAALLLFHVVGLSGAEVAGALDRSRAATYALLRRAERALRAELEP